MKKYVTWAYFSVSATWSWRQPARETASASDGTSSGGKATSTGRPASYSVIVTTSRSRGAGRPSGPVRSKPSNAGVGQGVDQLAGAIGPEVGVDDRVAVADPPVDPVDDRRQDELVVLAPGVAGLVTAASALGARSPAPWTIAW